MGRGGPEPGAGAGARPDRRARTAAHRAEEAAGGRELAVRRDAAGSPRRRVRPVHAAQGAAQAAAGAARRPRAAVALPRRRPAAERGRVRRRRVVDADRGRASERECSECQ